VKFLCSGLQRVEKLPVVHDLEFQAGTRPRGDLLMTGM